MPSRDRLECCFPCHRFADLLRHRLERRSALWSQRSSQAWHRCSGMKASVTASYLGFVHPGVREDRLNYPKAGVIEYPTIN
jgi:hypothetical protein